MDFDDDWAIFRPTRQPPPPGEEGTSAWAFFCEGKQISPFHLFRIEDIDENDVTRFALRWSPEKVVAVDEFRVFYRGDLVFRHTIEDTFILPGEHISYNLALKGLRRSILLRDAIKNLPPAI